MQITPPPFARPLVSPWLASVLCTCALLAGCQASAPTLPERPAALLTAAAFNQAIDHAVDDLLIQAQHLPEFQPPAPGALDKLLRQEQPAAARVRIALDGALDGKTGQQTQATRFLDERLLARAVARFTTMEVVPMADAAAGTARFVLTGTLTPLDSRTGKSASYRINLSLSDTRTSLVIAQASARASGESVDTTPTHFYRDSPSLTKDRTVEGQIRTAQAEVGAEADGVYLSSLSVAALVAEGARLYEAQQYEQALAVYETAAARPEGRHLRVLNGLYLSNTKLGRSKAAEQAFHNLAVQGLASNSLSVKFLFRPGTTEFWADPQISGVYPMWLRVLAGSIAESRACVTLVGHTSRTGSEQANDRLSLQRAETLQKRLESEAPQIAGRLQAKGMGFHENIIGIGTDDARDSLDRRVDFRIRKC